MKKNPYATEKSLKTRILNFFRVPFTWLIPEAFLLKLLSLNRSFGEKIIPSPYLYSKSTWRQVIRWGGLRFNLDLSNKNDHQVYFYKPPRHILKAINFIDRANCVIFDIGANIGYTALLFASRLPKSVIYAFEPFPDSFRKAQKNISLNGMEDQIRLLNLGLGGGRSEAKLYQVSEHNTGMNRIKTRGKSQFPGTTVELESLDEFVIENNITQMDLLKIDVEGYEPEVMEGALKSIRRFTPLLLIEICDDMLQDGDSSAVKFVNDLESLGYLIIDLSDDQPLDSTSPKLPGCYLDVLCIHPQ